MGMNPRLLRPTASGFDPRSLGNLELWLDGSDRSKMFDATTGGSLVADSAGVARWEDKSGKGHHATQDTANNRPTVLANAYQGRSALSYDGSNDVLTSSFNPSVFLNSPFTLVVVFERTTSPVFPVLMAVPSAGGNGRGRDVFLRSNDLYKISYGQNSSDVNGTEPATINKRFGAVVTNNNNAVSIYVQNVLTVTGTPVGTNPVTGTSYTIGAVGTSNYFGGRIYESMIFSRSLSAAEVSTLYRSMLIPKWGLA
jgi:hypothetical protein